MMTELDEYEYFNDIGGIYSGLYKLNTDIDFIKDNYNKYKEMLNKIGLTNDDVIMYNEFNQQPYIKCNYSKKLIETLIELKEYKFYYCFKKYDNGSIYDETINIYYY